jgi:hypothetical protein
MGVLIACLKHPRYKAIRPPKTCMDCQRLWDLIQQVQRWPRYYIARRTKWL